MADKIKNYKLLFPKIPVSHKEGDMGQDGMSNGTLLVGEIFKAFPRASAVAIKPVRPICKGCTLLVEGFGQQVASSLEINRRPVEEVPAGTSFGLLIDNSDFTISAVRKELIAREYRAKATRMPARGIKVFLLTEGRTVAPEEATPESAEDRANPPSGQDIRPGHEHV